MICAAVLFALHELSLKLLDALTFACVIFRCSVVTIPLVVEAAIVVEVTLDPCATPIPTKTGLNNATNAIMTTVRML